LPYGLDTATIDFETGERKLDVDKSKIAATERGIVRQVGNAKIEDACGDGSCSALGAAQCERAFVWHTHVMQADGCAIVSGI
jgi:hypothetical protein